MARSIALLLIDVQRDVLRGVGPAERWPQTEQCFEETVHRLCEVKERAHAAGVRTILVQHAGSRGHRLETGSPGWQLHPALPRQDGDKVIEKTTSDSFYRTDLQKLLEEEHIRTLVVGGFLSQYCVDLSVRHAIDLGYDVTLLSDGHSTCDDAGLSFQQIIAYHNAILPALKKEGHGVRVQASGSLTF